MAAIQSQGLASQSIGPQDAFGQVMGPEHTGRVRGLGLGAAPSRVFGSFTHGASSSINLSESTIHLNKIAELQAQLKADLRKSSFYRVVCTTSSGNFQMLPHYQSWLHYSIQRTI